MKKLLIILFIFICGVSVGQIWQPVDPTGVMYFEPTTGTRITITPSAIDVETTFDYTGVHTPVKMEITAYDSIGHFDGRRTISLPFKNEEICQRIYRYAVTTSGEFIFTIYGTPKHQSNYLICYSIVIFTYKTQQRYEEYLKSIYR